MRNDFIFYMTCKPPFRNDVVGSFLRPQAIHDARRQFAEGKITKEQLTEIENKEICHLCECEKRVGLHAVTDGEFRRAFWHLDFLSELIGIQKVDSGVFPVHFKGVQPKAETIKIVGKIDFPENHSFLNHFKYLQSIANGTLVKQTIPSPSMVHLICCLRDEHYQPIDIYKNVDDLYNDVALAYQKAVKAFYDLGCRYLQLDDTAWGQFCSLEKRAEFKQKGIDIDEVSRKYVQVINKVLEAKPADMTMTMHICRGNFRSTWFTSGGYEPVAEILFGGCNIDGFFLEYDSERAGGFEPLRFIKKQRVVLGLVTSKTPELENKEDIKKRIQEATQYVPLEQLSLSPQCGFASTEEGNLLTEEEQWKKLELIRDISQEVWK